MANTDNLDEKVVVKNLCAWNLYFPRVESIGEVKFSANGKMRLTKAEIQAQVFADNKMFTGTDGKGSHARVYIDDKDTRVLVEFEEVDSKESQQILDKGTVTKLLAYKTQSSFEKNVKELVKTQAEKNFLAEESKKQNLNDFGKISFIEKYTGYKFDKK